ncbi:hypothetical protein CERSUDRAFT_106011 [Gelatoporia subvermispora B]|uniref:Uncharacterized protein n=1 Tax=Ceriporiopsis subvermispora (strain B) TaxID=914234 RepID=M2RDV1_CERS8|nr:hypothetical protein CERSUDRAFT_106011 [Gelatoporia subvermispora B]
MVEFYGFLLNHEALLEFGIEKGLGSSDTPISRECLKCRAARKLVQDAGADKWCTVEYVMTKTGNLYWCIALASTSRRKSVYTYPNNMPPQELVDEMRAFLNKPDDVQAMWWKAIS